MRSCRTDKEVTGCRRQAKDIEEDIHCKEEDWEGTTSRDCPGTDPRCDTTCYLQKAVAPQTLHTPRGGLWEERLETS